MISPNVDIAHEIEEAQRKDEDEFRRKFEKLVKHYRSKGYAVTKEGKIDHDRYDRKGVIRRSVAWCLEKLGKRKTD